MGDFENAANHPGAMLEQFADTCVPSYLPTMRAPITLPITPVRCWNNLLALACQATFPPCVRRYIEEFNMTVELPSYPCQSACDTTNDECAQFRSISQYPALNCTEIGAFGVPQYPPDSEKLNISGVILDSTCFPYSQLPNQFKIWEYNQTCPYPLVRTVPQVQNYSLGLCSIPCPDFSLQRSQWMTIGKVQFSFALISFLLMALLSIHYLLDPSKRHPTQRYQLYSFLCQMMFAMAFMVGGSDPVDNVWCEYGQKFSDVHRASCGAQAILFLVFALAASIWWSICSVQLYWCLERREGSTVQHELGYIGIAVSIPLILVTVAAKKGLLFFYWLSPVCFVQGSVPHSDFSWAFIFFYLPMCVPMLVALGFNTTTLARLIKHMQVMKETFKKHEDNGKVSLFLINLRLFIWCVFLFLFFFTLVIYRSILQERSTHLTARAFAWTGCKINYALGVITDDSLCPGNAFPNDDFYRGTIFYYIIIVSMGTFSFITFGTSRAIIQFWHVLLRSIWDKKWAQAKELILDESAFSAYRLLYTKSDSKNISMEKTPTFQSPSSSPSSMHSAQPAVSLTASDSQSSNVQ